MITYMYKHMLKNNNATAITSLKSTHLCFFNLTRRYLSGNGVCEITVRTNDDAPVKGLFKNYGFTDTQVSKLFKKHPELLSLGINTIKPKLAFFQSFGFTSNDLCLIMTADPRILRHSLGNRIIPSLDFVKGLLKDNESVIAAVKRSAKIITEDVGKFVRPNMELLLNHGVPEYRILWMLRVQPRNLIQRADKFKRIIEEVKDMGFNPEKNHFVDAIHLCTSLSKSTRERKWDLYRSWGWSDDQIVSAFSKQPFIMSTSEEKLERVMDFLLNKMGRDVSQVSSCPLVMMHSLENWTMPRCLVVKFLLSKGALKENLTLSYFIALKGEIFRKRFVDKFCVKYPEVINLYGRTEDDAQKFSRKVTN